MAMAMMTFGNTVRAAVLVLGALLATFSLTSCQTAAGLADHPDLIGSSDRLPPFTAPSKGRGAIVSFLPFIGVPANSADTIYKFIRENAERVGVHLALRLDEPATYRVQTHINAVGGTAAMTYVFIVEIYDVSGQRVHRFVGQEVGGGAAGDPWSGTTPSNQIGWRILSGVQSWLTRSGA